MQAGKFWWVLIVFFHGMFLHAQQDIVKIREIKILSDKMLKGLQMAMDDDTKKAHLIFDEVLNESIAKDYSELIPFIVNAQSRLHAIKNEYDKGLEKLLKAEPVILKDSVSTVAGDYYENIAQCYLHLNDYNKALMAFKKCESVRLKVEPPKNWRTYNGMARVYHKMNRHEEAEKYSSKAEKLAKIQNSRKVIIDLQNDLRFDEKDGTISALSKEKTTALHNLKRSNQRNLMLWSGLGIFALMVGLLYIVLRQRNKLNRELQFKNNIISKALEEKEYLIKEVHHRVKNNLQVISSLLSLQSRTVEDQVAVDALNESQSRVLSMSLIHQNLYKDGPSSQLNVKTYLTNLGENIFSTYNIQKDKIKLITEIDDVTLDVGSLVPIGLIVNELITNALKYAFEGREKGNIFLSLKSGNEQLVLKVKDDGIGKSPLQDKNGFGTRLIQTFAKRLNGEITCDVNNGTSIEIRIKDFKPTL
jgi:two-component sensor histidine kinase